MISGIIIDEYIAIAEAITEARKSPCSKSRRGVVIFHRGLKGLTSAGIHARGFNGPPPPMTCDGSVECKSACSKICIHAEASALIDLLGLAMDPARLSDLEMLHVKVVDGQAVASGPPSCWQCSRLILKAGISKMWLLHDDGLRSYTAQEFHALTLERCGLPAIQ